MQATGERTRERQHRETFSLHTHEYCSRWRRIEGGTKLGGGRSSHSRTHTRSEQCAAWAGRNGGEYSERGRQTENVTINNSEGAGRVPLFSNEEERKDEAQNWPHTTDTAAMQAPIAYFQLPYVEGSFFHFSVLH